MAAPYVLAKPAFDLLSLVNEMTADGLHDCVRRQTRLRVFRDRHDYREWLLPRNLLRCVQKVCYGTVIEVALIEWCRVPVIEQLSRVSDLEVRSMDEPLECPKRCPNPTPGPSDLEIRLLWESEDFGPEIGDKENELRAKIAKAAMWKKHPSR